MWGPHMTTQRLRRLKTSAHRACVYNLLPLQRGNEGSTSGEMNLVKWVNVQFWICLNLLSHTGEGLKKETFESYLLSGAEHLAFRFLAEAVSGWTSLCHHRKCQTLVKTLCRPTTGPITGSVSNQGLNLWPSDQWRTCSTELNRNTLLDQKPDQKHLDVWTRTSLGSKNILPTGSRSLNWATFSFFTLTLCSLWRGAEILAQTQWPTTSNYRRRTEFHLQLW